MKQGESTRYECKVGGSPEIKVLWYKDETEIQESSKFRMSFHDSVAVLEMHALSVEDSGDYTCEARNAAGRASSSTTLKVKGQLLPFFHVFHVNFLLVVLSIPCLTLRRGSKNFKGHNRKSSVVFSLYGGMEN